MNRHAAKRWACRIAASWVDNDLDAGAEAFGSIERDSPDGERIEAALRELLRELYRRGRERDEPTGAE